MGKCMEDSRLKRTIYLVLGALALLVGVIGMLVPIMPTVPFLVLAALYFGRSSERLRRWLINHRVFGRYLHDYFTYRAIKRRVKVSALIGLWATVFAAMLVLRRAAVNYALVAMGAVISGHILSIKTLEDVKETDGGQRGVHAQERATGGERGDKAG
jgi:uncharacterized membrane protein YbaN (DUF454 family)